MPALINTPRNTIEIDLMDGFTAAAVHEIYHLLESPTFYQRLANYRNQLKVFAEDIWKFVNDGFLGQVDALNYFRVHRYSIPSDIEGLPPVETIIIFTPYAPQDYVEPNIRFVFNHPPVEVTGANTREILEFFHHFEVMYNVAEQTQVLIRGLDNSDKLRLLLDFDLLDSLRHDNVIFNAPKILFLRKTNVFSH